MIGCVFEAVKHKTAALARNHGPLLSFLTHGNRVLR